jgi:hypothetical protein
MLCVLLDLRSCYEGVALVNPGDASQVERRFCGFGQGKYNKARFQEKLLSINTQKPYRKPTQVGRSRRPRPTSERSPRN